MVNTGRPSPACKACRARRLKCDQTKPSCNKCTRAKRTCPGYREASETTFKDQTDLIIKKHTSSLPGTKKTAESARNGRKISSSPKAPTASADDCGFAEPTWSSLGLLRPKVPICERGTCYFINNFVTLENSLLGGNLKFLGQLYQSASGNRTFLSAFQAVSIASIASKPNAGHLIPLARAHYHEALKRVVLTVRDKKKALEDGNVAAIILLILYEVLLCENLKISLSFHLRGLQAISKMRGESERSSPVGQTMFEFINRLITHEYAHSSDPTGEYENILRWTKETAPVDEPRHQLSALNIETTLLRKRLTEFLERPPDPSSYGEAMTIYDEARELQAAVDECFSQCTDFSTRSVDYWQDDVPDDVPDDELRRSPVYPGKVYTFPNIFVAIKFLSNDVHLLILADIIIQVIDWMEEHHESQTFLSDQKADAKKTAQDQLSEVIATIPFFCRWPDPDSPSPFGTAAASFPIYVVGCSRSISKRQKMFLSGRLGHLASASGVRVAAKFADQLRNYNIPPPGLPS